MTYSIDPSSGEQLGEGLAAALKVAKQAASFGTSTSENGARMFGHVPHLAPEAWFHIIFPPLAGEDISELEKRLGRPVPQSYRDLLLRTNGLYLFSGSLSLYGLRRDYSRKISIREPFDLGDPNVYERPRRADPKWFIFSFYDEDSSNGYIDPRDGRVYRGNRDMTEPRLNQWASLDAFLEAEVRRLATHFDDRGKPWDPDRPTTPPQTVDTKLDG